MEFELGLKLSRTGNDDLTSTADVQVTKDPSGPLFVSKETASKFILTGYLKGFRKENIDIEINEAGNRISISGKKPVQEMVLRRGWIMQKKELEEMNVLFRKVFRIPEGVILDKIKANLNEETSNLTIMMPKLAKGYCGIVIEEVKEEEVDRGSRLEAIQDVDAVDPERKPGPGQVIVEPKIGEAKKPEEADGGESSRTLQNVAQAKTERVEERIQKETDEGTDEVKSKEEEYYQTAVEESPGRITETASSKPEEEEEAEISKTSEPSSETTDDILRDKIPEEKAPEEPLTGVEELTKLEESSCQVPDQPDAANKENEIDPSQAKADREDTSQMKKHVSKMNKVVCPPLVAAGSALLVSIIVLVFQLIRAKKR